MGERIVPPLSAEEQELAFQSAIARGEVVVARCFCTVWWIAKRDVDKACHSCGEPLVAVG